MAYLNVKERVIEAKIVYYGAGLSGKTTNLEQVKKLSTDGKCGDMMTLDTDGDRTLFFDWLPFNLGKFNGCDVRIQLYTVPGQAKYCETRKRVLASADGIVLVLDSQSGALDKNRQTISDLREHMHANHLAWGGVPIVVQLNKRDLPTAMAPGELLAAVGLDQSPYVEAVAAKGQGVFETLREASRLVLQGVRESARTRDPSLKSGEVSGLDGKTLYATIAHDDVTSLATAAPPPTPVPAVGPTAASTGPGPAAPGANTTPPVPTSPSSPAMVAAASTPASRAPSPAAAARPNGLSGSHAPSPPVVHGASNGAASSVKPAPSVTPGASGTNGVAGTNGASVTNGVAAVNGANGAAAARTEAAPATQLSEVIAGQRSLIRRMDAFEAAMTQSIATHVAVIEKRLTSKLSTVDALAGKIDAAMQGPQAQFGELRASLEALRSAIVESIDQAQQGLEMAVRSASDGVQRAVGTTQADLVRALGEVRNGQVAAERTADKRRDDLRAASLTREQFGGLIGAASSAVVDEIRVRTSAVTEQVERSREAGAAGVAAVRSDVMQSLGALSKRIDADATRGEAHLGELRKALEAAAARTLEATAGLGRAVEAPLKAIERSTGTLPASAARALEAHEATAAMLRSMSEALARQARELEASRAAAESRLEAGAARHAATVESAIAMASQTVESRFAALDVSLKAVAAPCEEIVNEMRQAKKSWWR